MTGKNLPAAELDVLACLQQQKEGTAREIRERMAKYRPMTHGAVVNLLKRLEAKALVTKEKGKVGKAFVYRPTPDAGSIYRSLLSRLVNRVFGGDSYALVSSLFETKPPSREQLVKLEELLEQLKKRSGRKEGR